jgi:exosome complex component RRP42
MSSAAIDDLSSDLSSILQTTLSHPTLHPKNLSILPRSKAWLLHLDLLVLSDQGNIIDALFLAAHAALRDTRVPRTRAISFRTDKENVENSSGLDTRQVTRATDFEVPDYWDEGELLDARGCWPIAVTLNVVDSSHFFLDASVGEETAVPVRLLLVISYHQSGTIEGSLQAMRLFGPAELGTTQIQDLVKVLIPTSFVSPTFLI